MNQRRRSTVGWGVAALLIATVVGGALLPSAASAEEKQVFFRGGFAGLTSDRGGEAFTSAYNALGAGRNDGSTGWYHGAGLDIGMHKNFLGVKGMSLVGELGLEFKRFKHSVLTNAA